MLASLLGFTAGYHGGMAVWRKKAYEAFGFPPGSYSYAGQRELFADLVEMARRAIIDDDKDILGRIVSFVSWAASQESDALDSAVDLAFFLPVLGDSSLAKHLEHLMPELMSAKRQLLTTEL